MNKRGKISAGITVVVVAVATLVYLSLPDGERTATTQAVDAESVLAIGCNDPLDCASVRVWYDVEIRTETGAVLVSDTQEIIVQPVDAQDGTRVLDDPEWPVSVSGARWVRVRFTGPAVIFGYHRSVYGDVDDCEGVDLCGYYLDEENNVLDRDARKFSYVGDQKYMYLPLLMRKAVSDG